MEQKNRYASLSDEELIKRFYNVPLFKLITNVIVFVVFVVAFILGGKNQMTGFFVALIIGSLLAIISRSLFGTEMRRSYAEEIKRRHLRNDLSDPYTYLFEKERELTGKIKALSPVILINVFSVIFGILNYLLTIISALLAIVFAAIPLIFSAFGIIAYIIFSAGHANGLASAMLSMAKYCTFPLKWAFKILKIALIPSIKVENFTSSIPKELNQEPLSKVQAELRIDSYLSFSGFVLPAGCRWAGAPSVSAAAASVYVEGKIICDSASHKCENDLNTSLDKCQDALREHFVKQLNRFLADYPQAERATVEVKLSGYIQ